MSSLQMDSIQTGDLIEIMRSMPDECLDLAFADPPYNLDKAYGKYEDDRREREYVEWCDRWLEEYVRLLKPTGSLFVLNLPKWCIHHAAFLSTRLYLQHWIVWDAPGEPRGKVFPAHYGILYYTKSPDQFTSNEQPKVYPPDFCFRNKCVPFREQWEHVMEPLSDIWWDIHRIRHKRDRDEHPCQLPVKLPERIISLASNPGDVVFDGFAGTGSMLVAAKSLGRRYVGIEIDPKYVSIAEAKLADAQISLPF